jgi:hypothetical protein
MEKSNVALYIIPFLAPVPLQSPTEQPSFEESTLCMYTYLLE